jgi:hypothetical protein
MNAQTILRAASLLAPADRRAEWMKEWQSELCYVPSNQATRFCLGSFRDALWLRRHQPCHPLESPLGCLAVLALCALPAGLLADRWERLLPFPGGHATSTFPALAIVVALIFLLAVFSRRWTFLALKIALLLPVLKCLLVAAALVPVGPLFLGGIMLLLRWAYVDQRRRCPICLRLLMNPLRMGTPAETFLDWYGGESLCARGHGILHINYSRRDVSWSGLL